MTRAVLSPRAQRELAAAVAWIARDSSTASRALRTAILAALETIGRHPEAGTVKPDIVPPPARFWRVRGFPYLLVYKPSTPRPRVLRIVHGARDLPEVLRDLGG